MTHSECVQRLAEARLALHELQIGKSVVEVWHEDGRMRYNAANKQDLVAYITTLESQCGGCCGPSRSAIGVRF